MSLGRSMFGLSHNPNYPAGVSDEDISDSVRTEARKTFEDLRMRDQDFIVNSFTETLSDEVLELQAGVDPKLVIERIVKAWESHRDKEVKRIGGEL
jgi:hypothetical protein